jgi:hypothetical protein
MTRREQYLEELRRERQEREVKKAWCDLSANIGRKRKRLIDEGRSDEVAEFDDAISRVLDANE